PSPPSRSLRSSPLPPALHMTPLFVLGVGCSSPQRLLRLVCFRALGAFFTFDLTIHPSHRLITTRPYSLVRHPAYTVSVLGRRVRAARRRPRGGGGAACAAALLGAVWWVMTLGIGLSRARAEDAQMRALFPHEWDKYATRVRWWWIPGVI
ncbi:hypothetical protein FB451DRAFT_1046131, partial [Mycena latifolia]